MRLPHWLVAPPPSVGVEIAEDRVTAVSLSRTDTSATIAAHAVVRLDDGLVRPALSTSNIEDGERVARAVGEALSAVGRPRRVALVVPDAAAKVSLLRLEQVPSRAEDLDQLVRWQMKKSAPFPIEEAQVSITRGSSPPEGGVEFVVTVIRRDIALEYEAVCRQAGAHAGIVDLATFNLVNLVLLGERADGEAGETMADAPLAPAAAVVGLRDWMLVNMAAGSTSIAIVRGADLIFFRNRATDQGGDLADQVHQARMYYEDRLGGEGLARVLLTGAVGRERLLTALRDLEGRLERPVESLDVRKAATLTDRISLAPELVGALAAPVGLVLREAA
jgi:Tfp pilus assembly PilM family ATPase